jgi:hypothetical protein
MQIRELTIERFRGIQSLTWQPLSGVVCLVGPGDSTKTTILDAIELVLGSRWAVSITDVDFHGGITDQPITITATVGQLPIALLDEDRYGLEIRGWDPSVGIRDEPEPGDESVLTVVFSVDDSLEPAWRVISDRRPEGRHMPSRDREHLGLVRLGVDIDRHLTWGRGSALTRNTDDLKEVSRVIAAAQREARGAVADAPLEKLKAAATKAQGAALRLGVRVASSYRPGLESNAVSVGIGQLTLHDGDIPVRASGLGSRRLNALALQTLSVESGACLLVDEVEHGLEPYRLRHLLRELMRAPGTGGQVFLTTHSEIPLEELDAKHINVVRCDNGQTTVRQVGTSLQGVTRSNPEAFLARRVVVCEGSTEIGFLNGLRSSWEDVYGGLPVAHTGVTFANGGGTSAGKRALAFSGLGYETAVVGDSDKPLMPIAAVLEAEGIEVLLWPGSVCLEERVALDLPLDELQVMLYFATANVGQEAVLAAISSRLRLATPLVTDSIDEWLAEGHKEAEFRAAIGRAAHKNGWFKDISRGQELGELVGSELNVLSDTDLGRTLARLSGWIYAT